MNPLEFLAFSMSDESGIAKISLDNLERYMAEFPSEQAAADNLIQGLGPDIASILMTAGYALFHSILKHGLPDHEGMVLFVEALVEHDPAPTTE